MAQVEPNSGGLRSEKARGHLKSARQRQAQAGESVDKLKSTPLAVAKFALFSLAAIALDAGLSYWQSGGNVSSTLWAAGDTTEAALAVGTLYGVTRGFGSGAGALFHFWGNIDNRIQAGTTEIAHRTTERARTSEEPEDE